MSTEYLNNKIFEKVIYEFQQSKREKNKYEICLEDINGAILRGNTSEFTSRKNDFDKLYKESNDKHEETKQQLACAFLILSENIVKYAKFNLIDIDDAIQEGVMICFEKIDRFDPVKGKAFNYMTTCVLNHFRQLYRTARNYNELKKKYQDFLETKVLGILVKNRKNHNYSKDYFVK